ncbi:formate dehydrogenase accessory protein FdhE [Anopheles sinensis]|uniref:Formate dehydrogenase accessory protein FdhE n=1 Tax=Anopheles sinensis TaxID=74873 RepID=A0A084VSC0_ANOSI|nr:formate dehydrogenase accessory protein FdhE [Anopheles sinensis]
MAAGRFFRLPRFDGGAWSLVLEMETHGTSGQRNGFSNRHDFPPPPPSRLTKYRVVGFVSNQLTAGGLREMVSFRGRKKWEKQIR